MIVYSHCRPIKAECGANLLIARHRLYIRLPELQCMIYRTIVFVSPFVCTLSISKCKSAVVVLNCSTIKRYCVVYSVLYRLTCLLKTCSLIKLSDSSLLTFSAYCAPFFSACKYFPVIKVTHCCSHSMPRFFWKFHFEYYTFIFDNFFFSSIYYIFF